MKGQGAALQHHSESIAVPKSGNSSSSGAGGGHSLSILRQQDLSVTLKGTNLLVALFV